MEIALIYIDGKEISGHEYRRIDNEIYLSLRLKMIIFLKKKFIKGYSPQIEVDYENPFE